MTKFAHLAEGYRDQALWPDDAPMSGLVVTRYGHIPERPQGLTQRIEIAEAAHPVPDAAGMAAAERILQLVQGLTADDLVLCLISGGGSALLTLPASCKTSRSAASIKRFRRVSQSCMVMGILRSGWVL